MLPLTEEALLGSAEGIRVCSQTLRGSECFLEANKKINFRFLPFGASPALIMPFKDIQMSLPVFIQNKSHMYLPLEGIPGPAQVMCARTHTRPLCSSEEPPEARGAQEGIPCIHGFRYPWISGAHLYIGGNPNVGSPALTPKSPRLTHSALVIELSYNLS